ncbi:BYPASS-related protein [Tanacetum coccineum]
MSKQDEKNMEDALIAIIKSIRDECRAVNKNKRISAQEVDFKKSLEDMEDTINNDDFTSNLPYQSSLEELNPGGFLFPFSIDNYNSYAMAHIDAKNNVMPRSICEYLMLANLEEACMSVKIDDLMQQETLGTVKNILVKIDKFEFPCDFVVVDMPENLGEIIILGRPFLETIHAQIDPTCDPDSKFCYGYNEVFGKTNRERLDNGYLSGIMRGVLYYEWVAQNYEFDNNRTPSTTTVSNKCPYKTNYPTLVPIDEWDTRCHITHTGDTSNQNIPNNDPTPLSLEHSELGDRANISESLKIQPFRPRPCDYSFDEWLKDKIGHTNIYNSDREIVFNEWILDSFDVEEEYAKEIGNPYSRIFDEYKRVFDNEVEIFSNEYILRVGKKGGQSFICITKHDDDALPLGRVNGARFKAMIRKELKDKGDIELAQDGDFSSGFLHRLITLFV